MMRKMKKWFSGFLCLTLLLGLLPTAAWAAEDEQTPSQTTAESPAASTTYQENDIVTRAILADLIYQNETLKKAIDAAGNGKSDVTFSDIGEGTNVTDSQRTGINALAKARFISGTGDGKFSPSENVTRAQAAVIFWRVTGSKQVPLTENLPFSDVFATDPYAPAVAAMAEAGIITGGEDGNFNPTGTLNVGGLKTLLSRCDGTSEEEGYQNPNFGNMPTAATRLEMLMKAYEKYKDSPLATVETEEIDYADIGTCTQEEQEAIQFFTSRGVVSGYNPNNNDGVNLFGPYDAASNLQAAMFLYRCAIKFNPDSVTETPGNEILSAQAVSYALNIPGGESGDTAKMVAAAWALFQEEMGVEAANKYKNNPDAVVLANDVDTLTEALEPAAPTFGTGESGNITISAEADAVIYYTTDESEPTVESARYTAPISATAGTTIQAVAVKNSLYSEVAALEKGTVTVTTNEGFLEAAQNANVTKIIVGGDIEVDAESEDSAALATVETDKEIEIGEGVRFSIAEGTCLKVTSGEGMFHYSDLPVQGEENFDRLIDHGVFFLLRSTEDGDYYREFYGSENAATEALTNEEGWTVAVIPSGSIEIPADKTLDVSVLYTGEEASIAKKVTTLGQLEAAAGIMGLSEIIVAGDITIDKYIIVPQTLTVEEGCTLTIKNGEYDREAFEKNYLDQYVPEDYLASPLHKHLAEDPSYEGNAGVDDRMVVYRIVDDADELAGVINDGEGIYFAADMTIPAGVTEISAPVEIGTDVKLTLTGDLRMPPLYHRFGYQHIGRVDQENFDQLAEDGIQFLIHVMGDNAERLLRPATLYAAGLSENYWTTAILVGVEATMPEFGISNERTVVITEDAAVGGETGVIQVYGNLVLEEGVTLRTGWLTVHDGEIYLAEGADLDVAEDIDGTVTGPGADDDDDDDDHSGGGNPGGSSSSGSQTETERNPDGSTTTTVTRPNGTVTETTRYPDGSREVVETRTDGTVTTTTTDASGNRTQVVERTDGSTVTDITLTDGTESTTTVSDSGRMETSVTVSRSAADAAEAEGEAAALPMPSVPVTRDQDSAPTVTVELPAGTTSKVEIPVEDVTPGTVAVAVLPDGTEQVIRTTQNTENGLVLTVEGEVTVKIVDNSTDFTDVPGSHWAADAVAFVSARELFNGTSAQTFSPNAPTTRAQLMTVLARLDGADASGSNALQQGIAWAVESGISNGSDPGAAISRQQLVTMLYRYAGSPATEYVLDYPDTAQVSAYATDAMRWAVENGIINGTSSGTLDPYGTATRSQMAAILMRYYALME